MAKTSSRSWPVGKRVRFKPNAASLAMYSSAPAPGTVGKVISVSVGSKRVTYLPGPGGGLVYVDWEGLGVLGVSPIDLESAKVAKKNPSVKKERAKLSKKPSGRTKASRPRGKKARSNPARRFNQKGYQYYVLLDGKIAGANEYRQDAVALMKDFDEPWRSRARVYSRKGLKTLGIDPDDNRYWGEPPEWRGLPPQKAAASLNPAKPAKRHLSVMQPYSPEWRARRQCGIPSENPAARVQRNDPSAMRAIMRKIIARPNPATGRAGPFIATRLSPAEIGLEAARIGKNVASLDPMEYFDAFSAQSNDPDAAMAALEDMAAWGVTDEI